MEGTIFQLYAANLYCESNCGSTYLNFPVYELEQSKGRYIRARLRFFTEAQYFIVRTALHRDQLSILRALRPPWVQHFVMNKQILNANAVLRAGL